MRGVTIRCFRETFAREIAQARFDEALTPFIPATPGMDPLKDRELRGAGQSGLPLVPQFIGKHPKAFGESLARIKAAGWRYADLNCGCPFPMIRKKGRGAGMLQHPDTLRAMLDAGCEALGEGALSVKTRLGVERADEMLALMPILNEYPLRYLCIHARTARQMYDGECDRAAFAQVARVARMPLVYNGDAKPGEVVPGSAGVMVGRAFIRDLGSREDSAELLSRYVAASLAELGSPHHVIGRIKELVAYWRDLPRWRKVWPAMKLARTLDEIEMQLSTRRCL